MSLDDMSATIADFDEAFSIARRSIGSLVDGRYTPNSASTIPATGVITPATPHDLLRLPEGRRSEETIRIITTTPIELLPDADVITWNATDYEVQTVGNWESFVDCLATKVIDQGGGK